MASGSIGYTDCRCSEVYNFVCAPCTRARERPVYWWTLSDGSAIAVTPGFGVASISPRHSAAGSVCAAGGTHARNTAGDTER